MKNLELNQMESIVGSVSNRDCMIRGAGLTVSIALGFVFPPAWGAALGIASTSGDCY